MRILGIETSCDETGIAIYDTHIGLIINKLYSQTKIHAKFGGVVPELAARNHINKIIPLIKEILLETNLSGSDINAIAYTAGPGLVSSLLVGATIGSALAFAWKIPAIAVNHIEGHLVSPLLENKEFKFPFICLLVSGGHTQLIYVKSIGQYKILGQSIDDAAGEAFDKIAKLLKLNYPGGAALSLIAKQGIKKKFIFPRPMINHPGLNFSFSGLKTFAANTINNSKMNTQVSADIACAFEDAIVDILIIKCKQALKQTGLKRLVMVGGVSANCTLRHSMCQEIQKIGGTVLYPSLEFCTDNGAMIALAGSLSNLNKSQLNNMNIIVKANWTLEEL